VLAIPPLLGRHARNLSIGGGFHLSEREYSQDSNSRVISRETVEKLNNPNFKPRVVWWMGNRASEKAQEVVLKNKRGKGFC
jgi:hypothetical protein